MSDADEILRTWASEVSSSRPTVGLAVSVLASGEVFTAVQGESDISAHRPITGDTLFRIGSITKTMTAIAVMQLWERGLVDLDAPAQDHIGTIRLVPRRREWPSPTIRHLLTHTSGIPDVLHVGHLLHPSWGPFEGRPPLLSVEVGEHPPSLARYYRKGIGVVSAPGSAFAYSNHGFAILGEIIERVSGQSLDEYLSQHIFEPLGMGDTTLVRARLEEPRLARGYRMGSRGPEAIIDREWIGAGGGGVYSTVRDLTAYLRALLGGGSTDHGSVLEPSTLSKMFDFHYRPVPGLVGVGLGFFRHDVAGRRIVGHDGILPGFNSSLLVAPDDDVAAIALCNGSRGAMAWLPRETEALVHRVIGVDEHARHTTAPQHPEMWERLCGRYRLPLVGDLRGRIAMGGGIEIRVRGGHLTARLLTPIPSLLHGFPLIPDDPDDPYRFRVELPNLGTVRLVFARDENDGAVLHTDLGGQPISLYETSSTVPRSTDRRLTIDTPRDKAVVDRLTDLDLVMLGASKTWPQDIGALAILDGRPLLDQTGSLRMDAIRDAVEARLHLVPRFRQIVLTPRAELGGPLWADDPSFDLANHLSEAGVASPGDEQTLLETIERLRRQPLDPTHPMWDLRFITGLAEERVGLYIRLHHTIADGMAAMTSVAAMLDTVPDLPVTPPPRWTPAVTPSDDTLQADLSDRRKARLKTRATGLAHPRRAIQRMIRIWPAVREIVAETPATKTSLDRMVGATRDVALVRTDLDEVKQVAHANGASVNDVLVSLVAGGLRALLAKRGEPVEDITVRIYVPVSLRRRSLLPQHGNLISQMAVPVRLGEPDPVRMLRAVAAETRKRKARARPSLAILMHGHLVRRLALGLVTRQRVNVTTASITGPSTQLYLAGARLLEVFPVLPLIANEPLGVGALSYAGGLYIGITADGEAFPDLDVFSSAFRRGLDALLSLRVPNPTLERTNK